MQKLERAHSYCVNVYRLLTLSYVSSYVYASQTGVQSTLSMLSPGESEGMSPKKLNIRCQETEFGGISANKIVSSKLFLYL